MHIEFFSPISTKFINSTLFRQNFKNFPPIFVQFTFFGLICGFWFPSILTMMRLCIMIYAYWKPRFISNHLSATDTVVMMTMVKLFILCKIIKD